jgi:hypothetical protein
MVRVGIAAERERGAEAAGKEKEQRRSLRVGEFESLGVKEISESASKIAVHNLASARRSYLKANLST